MYIYNIYGFYVHSDIKFPFLSNISKPSKFLDKDIIYILNGKKNEKKIKPNDYEGYSTLSLNKGHIQNKNSKIIIQNGNSIYYFVNNKDINIRFMINLLHGPVAYLLFQRKHFVLHGVTIEHNNYAYLVCGPSGSGKSSIGLELLSDFNLMSEDIVGIKYENNNLSVLPSLPILLCEHEPNNLNTKVFDAEINRNRKMYIINNNFFSKPCKPKKIIFLEWGNESLVTNISTSELLIKLIQNSFRPLPSNSCKNSEKVYFKNLMKFSNNVESYKIINKKGYKETTIKLLKKILSED